MPSHPAVVPAAALCVHALLMQATLTHYEGDTDTAGLCHGRGQALFSSGQSYEGDWQHGHMQGQGRIQFPDQIAYEGSFLADSISGSGVSTLGSYAQGGRQSGKL